ncbi:MAG TPA: 7,8-didemethyl-8-hydroxy-5-deazariboflavin synthase subunit CofH, partial [bacterium]|nr:7,8-didemethyl-8-hydroxy-5-deazariboflavin synthase subunit CofH [bacterium]
NHMALLRRIQRDTRGFTEFVPLSMIYQEAPMYHHHLVGRLRAGPSGTEVVKMHAIARIMLGTSFRNIQSSWVKEGPKLAQYLLAAGANDLGGTLINESISTAAGAGYGQLLPPQELRRLAREAGRVPAERSTMYKIRRVFGADDGPEPLDVAAADAARFGSYQQLIKTDKFRYRHPHHALIEPTETVS